MESCKSYTRPHVEYALRFTARMSKKRRADYLPTVLANSIRALLKDAPETALAKRGRIGTGSAHRIASVEKGGQNVRLSTLQQIANGYGLEAWELLVPGFTPEQRPRERLDALELEVAILRQQLQDVRSAVLNGTNHEPNAGGFGSDPAPRKAKSP